MSKQHSLSEEDKKLLEEIDQLMSCDEKDLQEEDSLYGFCAHMSSTIPCGNDDFKSSLENRILEEIEHIKQEHKAEDDNRYVKINSLPGEKSGILNSLKHYIKKIFMPRTGKQKLGFVLTIILIFIINLSISIPTLRANIIDVFKKIFVGHNTIVQQIDSQNNDFKPMMDRPAPVGFLNNRWFIKTDISNFSGNIFSTSSLDEAQSVSTIDIMVPETLPDGYSLREVKVVLKGVFLFYSGPGHDIIIAQTVVGNTLNKSTESVAISEYRQNTDASEGVYTIVTTTIAGTQTVDIKTEGSLKTVWMKPMLVWEEDGVSFSVGGLDLSEEQAVSIARSLKKYNVLESYR